ncbi:hypothetical protein [uncultured Actinomyces sp.]|jgi:hypothetical protein|uniref:hypothetical protein n=1 Tax=uncultured Actinomyces sp. TaxID=249061 RepID=UPI0028D5096B|nr:hypothetical protein [uncultured Actinomyces sp.]
MPIMEELVAYASEAGALLKEISGGHSMTWNSGLYSHHLWNADDEWFYGYSERGCERVPTMWSPHDQLVYKWAASRIAIDARAALELPPIVLPNTIETLGPEWKLVQWTALLGGLSLEEDQIPMTMRTVFPQCRTLIEYSHLIRLSYDEVLASYRAPDGTPRLGSFVSW